MKKIAKYLTMSLGILALVIYLAGGLGVFDMDNLFSYLYPILLILMGLATILMLGFMFVEWLAPSAIKNTLISFGFLLVIFIVSYAIADSDPLKNRCIGEYSQTYRHGDMGIYFNCHYSNCLSSLV